MFQQNQGCPGSAARQFQPAAGSTAEPQTDSIAPQSQLSQWPVQLMLVPTHAAWFTGADLAITADCVPFAFADFHNKFLKGRPLVVGCPKLDNAHIYVEKLAEILSLHNLKAVEVVIMEVPCCSGLVQIARAAREQAGVKTPIRVTTIGVRGEFLGTEELTQQ